MESPMKELYPTMRLDLREYADVLRDEAHQKRVWIEHLPSEKQDNFTVSIWPIPRRCVFRMRGQAQVLRSGISCRRNSMPAGVKAVVERLLSP